MLLSTTAAWASLPASAQVQENSAYPAERMRAVLDDDGIIAVESATVPGHLQLGLGLWSGYAQSPLVLRDAEGNRTGSLLSSRRGGSLVGSLGMGRTFQVGLELPLIFFQRRNETTAQAMNPLSPIAMGGFGDVRLVG